MRKIEATAKSLLLLSWFFLSVSAFAYSLPEAEQRIRADLNSKARSNESITVYANPIKMTAVGIGKIALTVVGDKDGAQNMTDWKQIPMASLTDIIVINSDAYVTQTLLAIPDAALGTDNLGVFGVYFRVEDQTQFCGAIVRTRQSDIMYFDCREVK